MKKNKQKGFTLIELILYIGIASVVLLVITSFFQMTLSSKAKNKTILEVEQQGMQVMQIITQAVINSEGITSPSAGNSSSGVVLDVVTVSDDPTVFDLSGGTIRITEGAGSPINITSSLVNVDSLIFENLSKADTAGILRIEFTISYINNAGRNEYDWSKTFYSSISLR
ncbi:hypothetical protein C0580_03515 [Candidatus Parcubacteria bacterium]|nr:MAG: hypothetical protein C0580_03515 [Candidatus Parcubacteria bacterium]